MFFMIKNISTMLIWLQQGPDRFSIGGEARRNLSGWTKYVIFKIHMKII